MQISCNAGQVVLVATAEEGMGAFAAGMNVPKDVSLDRKALTSWLKHHCAVLQWACANAFETKDHPEKGLDHVFFIQLKAVVHPTSREHTAAKPQLQIDRASLVNHDYLFNKYPGVVALFAQKKEADAIQGQAEGVVSYSMVVQYDAKWDLQQMTWEQRELEELEKQKNWVDVLLSITKGKKEFKMVNGNPVRQQ